MTQVDCIITAAGLSTRMGQWKMMLPCQDGTILDASIKNAQSFCSHIILVIGFRHQELAERYSSHQGITIVYNPDYQHGLFSSVQAGAQALIHDYCFFGYNELMERYSQSIRALQGTRFWLNARLCCAACHKAKAKRYASA